MIVALALIAFALIGFIAGALYELSRPGDSEDLRWQLADSRAEAARANLARINARRWAA